jgi:hypothetical protein
MCEERIASQRHQLEILSRKESLLESVNSIAGQLAELFVEKTSRPVSTGSKRLNLSTNFADLQEEIAWTMIAISNPAARHAFGAAFKAAMESHSDTMANDQPLSQRATRSTPRKPRTSAQDMSATSNIEHNTSIPRNRKRAASPSAYDYSCGTKRIRCADRSTTSITDFFGGRIYIQTDTYKIVMNTSSDRETVDNRNLTEHKTVFTCHSARWLLRRGFDSGIDVLIMKAIQGWQYQMRTFRVVPYDSLIFEFCSNGNLDGLRSLLVRKEASPRDMNSYGWNPLHMSLRLPATVQRASAFFVDRCNVSSHYLSRFKAVAFPIHTHPTVSTLLKSSSSNAACKIASQRCHVDLCRLLLDEGADPNAKKYRLDSSADKRPL